MKNKNLENLIIPVIVIVLLTFSGTTEAQINRNSSISGFVFDSQRTPIPQIVVELLDEVNSVIGRTKTNGSGQFSFRGLSSGRFQVRVLPLGTNFEEQTQTVELTGVGAMGRTIADFAQKDFYLKERKKSSDAFTVNEVIFVQNIPKEAENLYEQATKSIDDDMTKSIKHLEEAIKIFPNYYLALRALGQIYLQQKDYDKALDVFTKGSNINDRSFSCWYGIGYASFALKESEGATTALEKAIQIDPKAVNALFLLGIAQRQIKQYDKAEQSLLNAKKYSTDDVPDIHWNLALLYAHNLNRYSDAATQLELYLKASPENPDKDMIKKLIKQFRDKAK